MSPILAGLGVVVNYSASADDSPYCEGTNRRWPMTTQRKQFFVGVIALVAVAAILSFVSLDAGADPGNNNGKGKGQFQPTACEPCTDACVEPPPAGEPLGSCSDSRGNGGEHFLATHACCCCTEGGEGRYWL